MTKGMFEFKRDEVLRELARQYADGKLTTDDYLDMMEEVANRMVEG